MALILAITAGIGFSVFFLALAETNDEAGMWPLFIARLVSVPVVCAIAWRVTGRIWPVDATTRRLAVATGVTEMIANGLLLIALRRELAVASVFGSLYPVSTVLLAWVVLQERVSRTQLVGVGLAVGALILVAGGVLRAAGPLPAFNARFCPVIVRITLSLRPEYLLPGNAF